MNNPGGEAQLAQTFQFIRGTETGRIEYDWAEGADVLRKALADSPDAKNVAFLLGAGCPSLRVDKNKVGIPTMVPLASEFTKTHEQDVAGLHFIRDW